MGAVWMRAVCAMLCLCLAGSSLSAAEAQQVGGSTGASAGAQLHAQTGPATDEAYAQAVAEQALGEDAFDIIPGGVWLFGLYYRHTVVPDVLQKIFFDKAPLINNHAGGLVVTRRFGDGFSIAFGAGYLDYSFDGFFRVRNDPWDDTEHVNSNLGLVHGTASFLWAGDLTDWLAIEYGVGFDFGVVAGDLVRSEAYVESATGLWRRCRGAELPIEPVPQGAALTPDRRNQYCEPTTSGLLTDPAGDPGAHYGAKVKRLSAGGQLPDVFLFPIIPHVGIRIAPVPEFTLKIEAGYSLLHVWAGASIHGGFEVAPTKVPRPVRVVERTIEVEEKPPPKGRIRGLVVEQGPGTPIKGVTVRFSGVDLSPLVSDETGRFMSYQLDPGKIGMELSHPDYESGTCTATIAAEGGEVEQRCELVAKPRVGAIDGRVVNSQGVPVDRAQVQLQGPVNKMVYTDANGRFVSDQIPPGNYTARVDAEGYLLKLHQFDVVVRQTANPMVTLIDKPKKSFVRVRDDEIVIRRKINFVTDSAEIQPSAEPLLTEIADVLLRHPEIRLVEVQGHTDDRGGASYNLDLSQRRAESVRQWLVAANVEAVRLEARGHGLTQPIASNRSATGRAKNRRVQFMIKQRDQSAVP